MPFARLLAFLRAILFDFFLCGVMVQTAGRFVRAKPPPTLERRDRAEVGVGRRWRTPERRRARGKRRTARRGRYPPPDRVSAHGTVVFVGRVRGPTWHIRGYA